MLSQLRRRIWQFGGIAIATAMFTPAAWGDPGLTDHTAQDPTPPWKDPPGDGRPFNPNEDVIPRIPRPTLPISEALRNMGPQHLGPSGPNGWDWSPIVTRGSSFEPGGSPAGPVPAPGAWALLGLGALMIRNSRRRR